MDDWYEKLTDEQRKRANKLLTAVNLLAETDEEKDELIGFMGLFAALPEKNQKDFVRSMFKNMADFFENE